MDQSGLRLASRGRERAWWLLIVAVAAAVLVAVLAKIGKAPVWVQLLCVGLGTGLGLLVIELRARRAQDDKIASVVRESVASGWEQLPRMGSAGVYDVGVHRAIEPIDYVQRDVEQDVERRLRVERRVLVVGPSMSGKTRLALQLTRHLYADYRLLVPKDGEALHRLLVAGATGTKLVVWLDDLDRYLSRDGLTTEVLDRFHEQGNVFVATIGSAAYEALLPSGDLKPAGWEVPGWFGDLVWVTKWSDAELDRAVTTGIPGKVLAGARRYGLSGYLGGGPLARDKLRTGETTHRLGYALVRAAADWRRVGMSSPVPESVLVALVPVYLDRRSGRPKVDEEAIRKGLEWATSLINDSVALLEQANGGYFVLDYVRDFLSSQNTPIPAQAWDAALEHADPADLISVGYRAATDRLKDVETSAETRDRLLDVAVTAWRRSAAHGNARAQSNLGVLLAPALTFTFEESAPGHLVLLAESWQGHPVKVDIGNIDTIRNACRDAGDYLTEFANMVAEAPRGETGTRQVYEAFKILLACGRRLGFLFAGGNVDALHALQTAFREARLDWREQTPIVQLAGPKDTTAFPLELVPMLDFGEIPPLEDASTIETIASRFLGFTAVISRVAINKTPAYQVDNVLHNTPALSVRYIGREEGFLFSLRRRGLVALDGPWPTSAVPPHEIVGRLVDALNDPQRSLDGHLDAVPAQLLHFEVQCNADKPTDDKYELKLHSGISVELGTIYSGYKLFSNKHPVPPTRPLVILNASGNSSVDPVSMFSFQRHFLDNGHRAFIGTQVAIDDTTSADYAERFYRLLLGGHTIGQAVMLARRQLLADIGSPLGILYVQYGNAQLRVERPHLERSSEAGPP